MTKPLPVYLIKQEREQPERAMAWAIETIRRNAEPELDVDLSEREVENDSAWMARYLCVLARYIQARNAGEEVRR